MKKLLLICSFGLLLAFTTVVAQADEVTTRSEEQFKIGSGITPDSPFYFIDKGWESFRLWMTTNEEAEAKLLLKYAEERLSELNDLDEKKVSKYGDKLYEEYGRKLERVNEMLAKFVTKDDLDTDKIESLKDKLDHVSDVDLAVGEKRLNQISKEVRERIRETQMKAYAISIATDISEEEVTELKDLGFGYGEILKLQAYSQLANITIDELMYLDIFTEDEHGERVIDFGKLALELGIEQDALKSQFKEYKDAVRLVVKEKNQERKQELEQEQEQLQEQIRQQIQDAVDFRKEQLIAKVEEVYNTKVEQVNSLNITDERKTEIIASLDDVKQLLIETIQTKIEEEGLDPSDLSELNREITEKFNEILKDIGLSDSEEEQLRQKLEEVENQVTPLLNQIMNQYLNRNHLTLTEQEMNTIREEIIEQAREQFDEGKSVEFIARLRGLVIEKIEECLED